MIRLCRPDAVVIGGVDAHAGARDAGLVERDAGRHAHVRERAVAVVLIQPVRLRVVGDEQVHVAVVVVVDQRDAERSWSSDRTARPCASRLRTCRHPCCDRASGSAPCTIRACNTTSSCRRACRTDRILDRPLHVVGDEQIELAVVVVVEPRSARREPRIADRRPAPSRPSNFPSPQIVEQTIRPEAGHVDVDLARRCRKSAAATPRPYISIASPACRGHVGERAVLVVAVQRRMRRRARFAPASSSS